MPSITVLSKFTNKAKDELVTQPDKMGLHGTHQQDLERKPVACEHGRLNCGPSGCPLVKTLADKWILTRLNQTIGKVTGGTLRSEFGETDVSIISS